MNPRPITEWADALEAWIARTRPSLVDRVMVFAETGSTQDAASAHAGGRGGLLVLAARQPRGRGRLGRSWWDGGGGGLAMSLTLSIGPEPALPLRVGLAVAHAMTNACPLEQREKIGLRWPNDVVVRVDGGEPERKLAGVLIERANSLTIVGIGINVGPATGNGALVPSAFVTQFGSTDDRLGMALRVLEQLERWHTTSADRIAGAWARLDVLVGTEREFLCDGRGVRGRVTRVEPTSELVVADDDGREHHLSAATTSLVHTDPRGGTRGVKSNASTSTSPRSESLR